VCQPSHQPGWAVPGPERFRTGGIHPSSDIYALACVLYQCLNGELPFPGCTIEQVAVGHMVAAPPRPSEVSYTVPPGLDRVMEPAWPSRSPRCTTCPAGPHTNRRRRPGRRHPRGLPNDPRQHARGRHRRLGPVPSSQAHGESACAAEHPGAAHTASNFEGLVVRVDDAPRGAGHFWSWCTPLTIRPPGPNFTSRRTASAAGRIAPARSTTSGNSATSPPTRSKPTTGGPTPACTSCASTFGCSSRRPTPRPYPSATSPGPTRPPATDRGAQPDAFCRHAVRSSPVRLIPRRLRARADCPLPVVTLRVRIERSRH
jgi:serine/threonine protein kinase